jgi:hypothetical protein
MFNRKSLYNDLHKHMSYIRDFNGRVFLQTCFNFFYMYYSYLISYTANISLCYLFTVLIYIFLNLSQNFTLKSNIWDKII